MSENRLVEIGKGYPTTNVIDDMPRTAILAQVRNRV